MGGSGNEGIGLRSAAIGSTQIRLSHGCLTKETPSFVQRECRDGSARAPRAHLTVFVARTRGRPAASSRWRISTGLTPKCSVLWRVVPRARGMRDGLRYGRWPVRVKQGARRARESCIFIGRVTRGPAL